MAGWMTLIKLVPWGDVIAAAPQIASTARKFLGNVKTRAGESSVPAREPDNSAAGMRERLAALEEETVSLREQMLASSQLIEDLAEQNTQLIARVDAGRLQLRWLAAGLVVLGVVVVLLGTKLLGG